MKRIKELLKLDYRHYICIGITILFLALAIFYFTLCDNRLIESIIDIFTSSKYYISELFDLDLKGSITVIEFSNAPLRLPFK